MPMIWFLLVTWFWMGFILGVTYSDEIGAWLDRKFDKEKP